jgi:hypothetical protein
MYTAHSKVGPNTVLQSVTVVLLQLRTSVCRPITINYVAITNPTRRTNRLLNTVTGLHKTMTEQAIDPQPIYIVRIHATGMPRAVFTQDFMDMLKQIFRQMHPHGFPQFVRSPFLHCRLVWQ